MDLIIADHHEHLVIEEVNSAKSDYNFTVGEKSHFILVLLVNKSAVINLNIELSKSGAEARIIILVKLNAGEVILNTKQRHVAELGKSNLVVKSTLSNSSKFSYTGLIRLEKSAQKTDAYQRNDNLILSDTAWINSQPILEILANDVRCTHAAATSRPNPDQLWYLQSRGLYPAEAEKIIARGFIQSGLDILENNNSKIQVAERINEWL
jgi:Fe-S cluster assembly protein SufD